MRLLTFVFILPLASLPDPDFLKTSKAQSFLLLLSSSLRSLVEEGVGWLWKCVTGLRALVRPSGRHALVRPSGRRALVGTSCIGVVIFIFAHVIYQPVLTDRPVYI